MKVFLTSTLKYQFNLKFNPQLAVALEARGIVVYLPQRDTDQQASKEGLAPTKYRCYSKSRRQYNCFGKLYN